MNITITVNIGLTDQLAGFLTQIVGGASNQHRSETVKPKSPEKADPFASGAIEASSGQASTQDDATQTSDSGQTATTAASPSEKPKARGKAKTEPAADPFATKPSAGAAALGVGDAFSNNIRDASAESASAALATDQPAYTVKDLNDAASAAMAKIGAKGIKALLGDFKDANGAPVDRLSTVQVEDYGDVIGKLQEAVA